MSHDGSFDRLDAEKSPCMRTFQYRSESGGLRNPQTSAQLCGIDPSPHNGVGPGGVGNAQSAKASSIVLNVVSVAASPCCSIEITCNQVNLLTNHDGSDCEDEFFCNTPFWSVHVAYMKRQHRKSLLAAEWWSTT